MALTLSLLGGFQATLEKQVLDFPTQKARALLAYLALGGGKPRPRQSLCGLLWPELPEEAARNNLRKTLHHLHKALDLEPNLSQRLFTVTRQAVGLNPDAFTTDVAAFGALLAGCQAHAHRYLHTCSSCLAALEEALALYRGEFLAGLELPDAPAFDEWLLLERANLQNQVLAVLAKLADAWEKRGDAARALDYIGQQFLLDPYLEAAHRQRMRLLASSGQEREALGACEAWRVRLAEETGLEPEAATIALVEAIRSGAGSLQPIAPSPAHYFPAQFSACLGREDELMELEALLREPECRLLTLLGAGGVGKTRLAVALAERLAAKGAFPDGLTFISLAAATSAEQLWSALATSLEIESREGEDTPARVRACLKGKTCLLVLDNFEQVLAAAQQTASIVAAARGVRLLVTSRAPLNVRAEYRFPLEGLACPAREATADAFNYSAVQLFATAARRVLPGFRLSPENAGAVIRICRAVRGLPLALELAASWVRVMDCRSIATEIEGGLSLLETSLTDVPERHRSMAAVFAYTWKLLPAEARRLLAQLSVFRGPFGLEAVLEVTGANALELAILLDFSLLKRTPDAQYDLHELTRQFAAEKLGEDGSLAEEAWARHSVYYLNRVASQETALHSPGARQAVAALQAHLADIRQAWMWAVRHHRREALESSLEGLASFYDFTGLFQEAEGLMRSAIASDEEVDADSLSHLLVWQAHFLHRCGDTKAAIGAAQETLGMAERQESPEYQARAHNLLGELLLFKGDYAQARVHQQRALAFYKERGGQMLADALSRMGVISWRTGEYEQALALFGRALRLQRETGDAVGQAEVLSSVAGVHWERGELEQAQAYLRQAAELYATLGHKMGEAHSVGRLGIIHQEAGRFTEALVCYEEAILQFRELEYDAGRALFLSNKGVLLMELGTFEEALACLEQALDLDMALGNERATGRDMTNIGCALQSQGDLTRALQFFDQALPRLRAAGSDYLVLMPLYGKAKIRFTQGRYEEARTLAEEALELACKLGRKDSLLAAQGLLANLTAASGDTPGAAEQLRALLAGSETLEEQAALHYELWRLERSDTHATTALELYQELYSRFPSFTNETRLAELQQAGEVEHRKLSQSDSHRQRTAPIKG